MRSRKFWRTRGVISEMLVPCSLLWFWWMRIREMRAKPTKLSVPIICVGNVTIGGSGKTPVALALASLLLEKGHKPAFISRGYGGTLRGPLKVDAANHTASDTGDEPLLLARIAPCYIARERVLAAQAAIADGATILIADDGLQNHSFHKDLSLVVVDGSYGFGNQLVMPAGPLRDRLDYALKPAHAVVLIGRTHPKVMEAINKAALPIHTASLQPQTLPETMQPYVAFAGIGLPEKFFTTLQQCGVNVVRKVSFRDHHPYTAKDLKHLAELAAKFPAKLLTTEKDAVRLPPEFRAQVDVLLVQLVLDEPALFLKLLEPHLP